MQIIQITADVSGLIASLCLLSHITCNYALVDCSAAVLMSWLYITFINKCINPKHSIMSVQLNRRLLVSSTLFIFKDPPCFYASSILLMILTIFLVAYICFHACMFYFCRED